MKIIFTILTFLLSINYAQDRSVIFSTGSPDGTEGHSINWNGSSDTETLIECIDRWGIQKTLKECVGMFAVVLLDKQEKKPHIFNLIHIYFYSLLINFYFVHFYLGLNFQ